MGVAVGQAAMVVGNTAVLMNQQIPLHAADLVHPAVGNHDLHVVVGIKESHQLFRLHQAVGYLAGAAVMMGIDGLSAGSVGNGQPSSIL